MPTLELTDEQVVALIKQLPPERRKLALLALAQDARSRQEERMDYAESQLRQLCAQRGLNWDTMSEEAREAFVDDLIHEDRGCVP
ncbi:MAG: hypothetical protein ACP5RN_12420 [Armatimonadota bacterium]